MPKVTIGELEHGLRALYARVTREEVPDRFRALLDQMGELEPAAMGGNAAGSLPFAGGEVAAA